ncbi:hypothetical protein ACI6PS_02365 [Flavobacterium sp. PLA-1-15]|uniref:hypothetical protein n=1 Tax=Flavobacterium sp. PLA-1-15 TaxID=3380533 RepID=UPI003B7F5BB5
MDPLQSKINAAEARIQQLKDSELFTEADRQKLLPKAELELEQLLLQKADIEVNNPEKIISKFEAAIAGAIRSTFPEDRKDKM